MHLTQGTHLGRRTQPSLGSSFLMTRTHGYWRNAIRKVSPGPTHRSFGWRRSSNCWITGGSVQMRVCPHLFGAHHVRFSMAVSFAWIQSGVNGEGKARHCPRLNPPNLNQRKCPPMRIQGRKTLQRNFRILQMMILGMARKPITPLHCLRFTTRRRGTVGKL